MKFNNFRNFFFKYMFLKKLKEIMKKREKNKNVLNNLNIKVNIMNSLTMSNEKNFSYRIINHYSII